MPVMGAGNIGGANFNKKTGGVVSDWKKLTDLNPQDNFDFGLECPKIPNDQTQEND